jgi:hypothetical protein
MNINTKVNTALVLLRLGGECFQQHNLLSTATEAERKAALKRLLDWWNGRVVPFFAEEAREAALPFTIQTGYKVWAAMPRRALSPEVDYGVQWGLHARRDFPTWRVSLLVDTGEIFAVELQSMDRFAVLGVVEPDRKAAETALAGWADSDMTLAGFFNGRFDLPEHKDPVVEAAEELKKCVSALQRIAEAYAEAESHDVGETLAVIGRTLRSAGFDTDAEAA